MVYSIFAYVKNEFNSLVYLVTEDTANILDLFFSNNQSLVNRVDIIPGISDHEVVYVESSLRPSRATTPPRKVFCYNKGDFDTLKAELRIVRKEFESMEPTSTTQALWDKFQATVTDLMNKHIPTKTLNGKKKSHGSTGKSNPKCVGETSYFAE